MALADRSNCSGLVSAFLTIKRRLRAVPGSLGSWSVACHNPAQHEADHGEVDERNRFTSSAGRAICSAAEASAGLAAAGGSSWGNQRACRDAAPQIRRAGVKMPEPLIVLAALDPKFFGAMQPAGQ